MTPGVTHQDGKVRALVGRAVQRVAGVSGVEPAIMTPDEARALADVIRAEADAAEREDPVVVALANDLEAADTADTQNQYTHEDIAVFLARRGWRKPSSLDQYVE